MYNKLESVGSAFVLRQRGKYYHIICTFTSEGGAGRAGSRLVWLQ
jgi:hypothetical protein